MMGMRTLGWCRVSRLQPAQGVCVEGGGGEGLEGRVSVGCVCFVRLCECVRAWGKCLGMGQVCPGRCGGVGVRALPAVSDVRMASPTHTLCTSCHASLL